MTGVKVVLPERQVLLDFVLKNDLAIICKYLYILVLRNSINLIELASQLLL